MEAATYCCGPPAPGTWPGHSRLVPQPPRLRAASWHPCILEWVGQATTTITGTHLGGQRVDTGASGDLRGLA